MMQCVPVRTYVYMYVCTYIRLHYMHIIMHNLSCRPTYICRSTLVLDSLLAACVWWYVSCHLCDPGQCVLCPASVLLSVQHRTQPSWSWRDCLCWACTRWYLKYICTLRLILHRCLCAVMLCSSEFVHQFLLVARSGVCLYRDVHFHCVAVYFVCMLCKCLKFIFFAHSVEHRWTASYLFSTDNSWPCLRSPSPRTIKGDTRTHACVFTQIWTTCTYVHV